MAVRTKAKKSKGRRPRERRVPIAEVRDKELEWHAARGNGGSKPHTIALVHRVFRILMEDVRAKWANDLGDPDVVRRFDEAIPSRNLYSRRALLVPLRAIIRRSQMRGLVDSVPAFPAFVKVDVGSPRGARTAPPSPEDIARLLKYLEERSSQEGAEAWEYRRLHALVATVVLGGLGVWQALRLRVADVDLAGGVIWLVGGRASRWEGSPRVPLPIDARLRAILAGWIPHAGCDWVFPGKMRQGPWPYTGQQTRSKQLRQKRMPRPLNPMECLRAAAEACGIKRVSFESLRRFHRETAVLIPPGLDVPATRSESATSPATPPSAVELGKGKRSARFRGVLEHLTDGEFRAVKLLVDRYPDTYDSKEMNRAYGGGERSNTGWRGLLRGLKARGGHVDSSILFPADWRRIGRRGGIGIAPK